MTDLPQPLTPADCDLRGLPFMPLLITQVMQSETFGLSTGDEFKAAFTLWCVSWLEVPAASLPNNEKMLEFLSRAKSWRKVRDVALRGWILCGDGRLYHKVIAANALEAWEKRTDYRDKEESKNTRQQRWRDQCKELAGQLRELGIVPPRGASLDTLRALLEAHSVDGQASTHVDGQASTVDGVEIGKTETVKRQGQRQREGIKTTNPNPVPASPSAPRAPAEKPPTETGPTWAAYANAYQDRYGVMPVRNAKVNGQFSQLVKRLGAEESPLVAGYFVGHNSRWYVTKLHPVDLLLADAEKLRTEWATQTQMTTHRADQLDRTQTTYDAFAPLIAAAEAEDLAAKES